MGTSGSALIGAISYLCGWEFSRLREYRDKHGETLSVQYPSFDLPHYLNRNPSADQAVDEPLTMLGETTPKSR